MMTSPRGAAAVDHEFVTYVRNWSRGFAALGRGDGGEHRERRDCPFGRRRLAGDKLWRRPSAVIVGVAAHRARGREERRRRSRSSPEARRRGRRGRRWPESTGRCSTELRPWRRRPGRWQRLRAPRHGPVAPGGRGGRGGPGRHLRRARGGVGRRQFARQGGGGGRCAAPKLGLGFPGAGKSERGQRAGSGAASTYPASGRGAGRGAVRARSWRQEGDPHGRYRATGRRRIICEKTPASLFLFCFLFFLRQQFK